MYVMPLGPAASLVGVWHRGQRAATSSAMVGESCVPPQVPGEADAQRVWLSDAAAKLVAVCPWSDQWSLMIFDDLWWSLVIFDPFDAFDVRCFLRRHHSPCSQIQWLTVEASRKTERLQVARPAISFEECKQRCFVRLNHLGQDLKPWRSVHQRIQKFLLN